jgi:hypothetical protein
MSRGVFVLAFWLGTLVPVLAFAAAHDCAWVVPFGGNSAEWRCWDVAGTAGPLAQAGNAPWARGPEPAASSAGAEASAGRVEDMPPPPSQVRCKGVRCAR